MSCLAPHYAPPRQLVVQSAPERQELQPDDLLVRVTAAGINPADCQFRRGDYQAFSPLQFPAILGWDVAGVVERVGPPRADSSLAIESSRCATCRVPAYMQNSLRSRCALSRPHAPCP